MDARKEAELKVPPSSHSGDHPPYPTIDPTPKDVDVPNLPPYDTERGGSAAGGERNWSTIPMGAPSDSTPGEVRPSSTTSHLSPSWKSQQQSDASREGHPATMPFSSQDPYISASPAANRKNTMDTVRNVLGRWGKKVNDATKKAEILAENVWQHLKTGPSVADTAMGRIAQGTKVLAEGGYEKIFEQTFETLPGEKLQNTYACYLSTSAGPIIGIFYLSSAKLAFCSDNPLPYKAGDKTEWSYYKVVIPLHQLKSVNTSASKANPAEKYIQVTSIDNHEFWFMGFVSYDGAVEALENALAAHRPQRA